MHETAARARFHIKSVKTTEGTGALLEDEAGKRCTRLYSESSISDKNCQKTVTSGALVEDEVGKKCTRL